VIDIIRRVELIFDDATLGKNWTEQPVRAGALASGRGAAHNLVEAAVEHHEELMEKYLEGEEITEEELRSAIRAATLANAIVPVICGSAFKNKGVQQLLDAVIDYMPSPIDIPAIRGHDVDDPEQEIERHADDRSRSRPSRSRS
jgi:elongation factor G